MKLLLAAGLAALMIMASCTPPTEEKMEAAAPLSAAMLGGGTKSLAEYSGKVVLVDFWATWCDPCRAEIPDLIELQKKFGPKGFQVLGVSMDEDPAEIAPFVRQMGVNYPVLINGGERAPKGWIVPGLPTAYLVGRDGTILHRYIGAKSPATLAADIEKALAPSA